MFGDIVSGELIHNKVFDNDNKGILFQGDIDGYESLDLKKSKENLSAYMKVNNYDILDFEVYSKDPMWLMLYKETLSQQESLNTEICNKDIYEKYNEAVDFKVSSKDTNYLVKSLYNEYKEQIKVIDHEYMGTPFYNDSLEGIKLNIIADVFNPRGSYTSYFHETGHMIDDYAGNGHSWLSSDLEYKKCLKNDVEQYVNNIMEYYKCDIEEAYDVISEELSLDCYAGISDIFGSLTNCRCQGEWGHHYKYWELNPDAVEREAFANMFEASIGNLKKIQGMRKYFPTAYSRFEKIINDAII